jgi:hypothetical protein
VTAGPLANLKADLDESQKAVFDSQETSESSPADVDTKPAGKKNPAALSTAVESSEVISPLHSAADAAADMKSIPVTAKDRKEARKLRRKKIQNAVVDKKPAGGIDRLELAPAVESSEGFSPLQNAAAAAAAIHQASASRPSPRPPSARPWTLHTQEEPDMVQGFEKIVIPIAFEVVLGKVVLPDHESENKEAISEAQIIETGQTAKLCGQPRWLIFALLGVLVTIAIGAGLGVALGNGGDDRPPVFPDDDDDPLPVFSDRGFELQDRIIDEIPSLQFGSSQIQAINWLADEDPAMIDFETTSIETILVKYVMATLYFSWNGPEWVA